LAMEKKQTKEIWKQTSLFFSCCFLLNSIY
jgi:hypothetical protein